jgi:hypothetical protein
LQRISKLFDLPFESCLGHLLQVLAEKRQFSGFVASVREFVVDRNLPMTEELSKSVEKSVVALFKSLQGQLFIYLIDTDQRQGIELDQAFILYKKYPL